MTSTSQTSTSNFTKMFILKNASKFASGVGTILQKLHSISFPQMQKKSF